MTAPPKPVPEITPEMAPFFAAAREGRLVVQRCTGCGTLWFPARPRCSACLGKEATWVPVSGRGEIFSFVVMHQAAHPAFAARVPYPVVVVQLAEGVRMLSGVTGIAPEDLRIGMPVEVAFERRSDEVSVPVFRPAS